MLFRSSDPTYQAPDLTLVGPEHVRRYLETGGEVGYEWNGVHTLLLTTSGRRSSQPRTSALIFGRDGDDYVVVASKGGFPTHPEWYLNLLEEPAAHIQVRTEQVDVVAHTASDEDKPRLWRVMADIWPNYDAYQSRTDRQIPVVVLRPEH